MYRFLVRPRWLVFHVLVIVVVVVMVNLGFWQLRRLDERQARNDRVEQRSELAVEPVDAVLTLGASPDDVDDLEWRPVAATGTYDAERQVLIRNRSFDSAPGFHVVTPLDLGDATLLVNRGWIALGDNENPDVPPPPPGEVSVTGRIRPSQERASFGPSDPAEGVLDRLARVDVTRIAAQTPGRLYPAYIELTAAQPEPAQPPLLIPQPELSEGSHLSYAGQWFLFSAATIVAWVVVVRKAARQGGRFRPARRDAPEEYDLPVG